ncbi:MAG TPA: M50 family metallopeptidase, partial [Clostridia bacterium]|nr:M50 family metallopeptidase [Clostridia bacterium]
MRIKLNVFFILFLFASYFSGWLRQSLILFASVMLHEAGHVLAAKRLGIRVYEVELLPYGGVARMEELSKYGGFSEAAVSAAGPAVSLVLALVCFLLKAYSELFEFAYAYNLIICLFNLVPVIPMDGGRIARNAMVFFMGYRQATRSLTLAGKAAAFVLAGFNIHLLASGSRSAALLIAAVFIYIGTAKEEKLSSYYYLFTGNSTKRKLIAGGRIRKRHVRVREDMTIKWVVDRLSPVTLCQAEVVDGAGRIKRILNEEEIMDSFLKYGYYGRIGQI